MERCEQHFQHEIERAISAEISGARSVYLYRDLALCFAPFFVCLVKLILLLGQHKTTRCLNGAGSRFERGTE